MTELKEIEDSSQQVFNIERILYGKQKLNLNQRILKKEGLSGFSWGIWTSIVTKVGPDKVTTLEVRS